MSPWVTQSIIVVLLLCAGPSSAFNALTHEQLIKSTFQYLNSHVHYSPSTTKWIQQGEARKTNTTQNEIERVLIRAVIDVDYLSDLWIDAWYRAPFSGGKTRYFGMLTSLYHFLNATKPGKFWPHDGYSYENTDGTGNDSYLGIPGLKVRADLSVPLGGIAKQLLGKDRTLGAYKLNFKDEQTTWDNIYIKNSAMSRVVLPPANVPAQLAYNELMASPLAASDATESWKGELNIAENLVLTKAYERTFKRQEIMGLPSALDRLGITMHMAHDLAVPHHARGITGYCHNEFEEQVDRLACPRETELTQDDYDSGLFDSSIGHNCQQLYDPNIVEMLISYNSIFDIKNIKSVFDFLIDLAKLSARWEWGKIDKNLVGTVLPNRERLSAKKCSKLVDDAKLKEYYKFHYNLAVAATVVLFELAANDYAKIHDMQNPLAQATSNTKK